MAARPARFAAALFAGALLVTAVPPAVADHTDPNDPLTPIVDRGSQATHAGAGTWTHVENFGGVITGTDLEFFHRDGELYGAGGQLGQAAMPENPVGDISVSVGQRIIKLVDKDGNADSPEFVADHGSASCGDVSNANATTGLQHDTQVTPRAVSILGPGPKPDAELIIDTVDALGRCHDAAGGGLEFVDVSGLGTEEGFEPREVHLTRHNGYSHTVTVDATRPWLVYNSTSDFGADPDSENPMGIGKSWLDVLDIRTCLNNTGKTLDQKRTLCRPKVYRLPFNYEWSTQEKANGTKRQPSACHDITTRPGRVYCAAVNATIVFDVTGLTDAQGPDVPLPDDPRGDIKGKPLPCEVKDAVPAQNTGPTGAKVTDCALGDPNDAVKSITAWNEAGRPQAEGWKYLGHVNHPGRECNAPNGASTCNGNLQTPSDEGVAISHESDPSPGGRYLFVTDERGGGIVPPSASCVPTVDNPYGNGGLHVFDMTKKDDKGRFQYAEAAAGGKAVYITRDVLPTATFCTIHVIEQIPDEQRIIAAWYTQGVKVLDYEIDAEGKWTFTEVASYGYVGNDIWAAEVFKIDDTGDGNRTYHFMSNDVERGIDVFKWTGPKGPPLQNEFSKTVTDDGDDDDDDSDTGGDDDTDTPPAATPRIPTTGADLWVMALAMVLLPAAVLVRRRLARSA
ncbi:MAG TPA: hypothetical protein VNA20_00490 [Frankiaceae bacterium]|nr:hypothetical protein [Frankiaceae bacterium]